MIQRLGGRHCRMLAEKIETHAEFVRARDQGFVYFQGYFFRRPEMMNTHDMPANQMNYLRMLQEVSRPELEIKALEQLVKAEASVCYRLLRYLNSAMFGFQSEIHSVRHALSILGERDVRRWVRLVAAVGAGQEKTSDLVLSALVRGRFGELLSPRVAHGESDLFLLGIVVVDRRHAGNSDVEVVPEKIPLDHETKAVLLGQPSLLRPVYQLMLAHESGEWEAAAELSGKLTWIPRTWPVRTGRRRSGLGSFQRGVNAAPASDPCWSIASRNLVVMASCAKAAGDGPCAVSQGRVT